MTLAFGFGQGLRRDTAPVPATDFVTGDKFAAPNKIVPPSLAALARGRRDTLTLTSFGQCLKRVMLNKICTMTAKSAPYPPCLTAQTGRLAPRDAHFQLGQDLRRDSLVAKVPAPSTRGARCLRPDAPDAAVRIFDSVRAGSGNSHRRILAQ